MSAEKERTEVSTDYSFRQVLDLLVDQKELSPQLLLAALSLTNLLVLSTTLTTWKALYNCYSGPWGR